MLICTVKCKRGQGEERGRRSWSWGKEELSQGVECVTPELWDKKEVERRMNGILVGAAGVHGCEPPLMSQEWHLLCSGVRQCSEIEPHEPKLCTGYIRHGAQPIVNWR